MRRAAPLAICALPMMALAQDAAQPETDKGVLTRFLEGQLSGDGNSVDIRGFEGALSTRATIDRLAVSDPEGEWLVLTDLVFDWDRSALVTGRELIVQELTAREISVLRRPAPRPDLPSAEAEPFSLPRLPVNIYIGQLEAPDINIAPSVTGEEIDLRVDGTAALTRDRVFADFNAVRTDGADGRLAMAVDYQQEASTLRVDIAAHEQANGLMANWLKLPGAPSLDLSIQGAGPIDGYSADVSLRSDDQDRLTGQVGITGSGADQRYTLDLAGDLRALLVSDYQPFFGETATLASQLRRNGDGLELSRLSLRTGALDLKGTARVDANWWPTAFDLRGELSPQGRDTVLLPLPGPRSYARSGTFEANYDAAIAPDWNAQVSVADLDRPAFSAAQLGLDLTGRIERTQELERWSASGSYSADGLVMTDPGMALAVGPTIQGGLRLSGDDTMFVSLDHFTLIGPGLNASGTGLISAADQDYETDLGLFVVATDLGRFSGITGRDLTGAGQLSMDLGYRPFAGEWALDLRGITADLGIGNPRVDAILAGQGALTLIGSRDTTGTRLDTFTLRTDHAFVHGDGTITRTDTQIELQAEIPDSSLLSPDLIGPAQITATARRVDGGDTDAQLIASLPQIDARIDAVLGPNADSIPSAITGQIQLRDLSTYAELSGRALRGRGTIGFTGEGHLGSGDFDVNLQAQTFDLGLGQPQLDSLLAGFGRLEGRLQRNAGGNFYVLQKLDIRTPYMSGTAHGALQGGTVVANLDANVPNAAVLAPGLQGAMTIRGRARQAEAGSTAVSFVADAPGGKLDATADIAQSGRTSFVAALDLEDLAPYGSVAGQSLGGALRLNLRGGISEVDGAIRVDIDGKGQDLILNPDIPALSSLLRGTSQITAQGLRDGAGAYHVDNLNIFGDGIQMRANGVIGPNDLQGGIAARLPDLSLLDVGLSGPGDLRLDATPDGYSTDITLTAQAPSTQITGTATMASRARAYATQFDLSGDIGDLRLIEGLTGRRLRGGMEFAASGSAKPRRGRIDARLRGTTRNLGFGDAALNAIMAGSGRFAADLARSETGSFRIDAGQLRLPNFTADLTGSRAANGGIDADFSAQIIDMARLNDRLSGRLSAKGAARVQDGRSTVNVALEGTGGSSATITGQITPAGQPDLALRGSLPLALANPSLAPQALSGIADLDLRLSGSWAPTGISGTVRTSGARVSIPQRRTAITGIDGSLALQDGRVQVNLSGQELRGGRVGINGSIDLRGRWPADLRITAQDLIIRDPVLFETTAQADLTLRGLLRGGAIIGGKVSLARTEITVPSGGLGRVGPLMDIRHTNVPGSVRQTLNRAGLTIAGVDIRRGGDSTTGSGARDALRYGLDLQVDAPARIFVRGRGIDAELGGSFRIGGDTARMVPAGRLELVRGRINILQQRFTLNEGYGMLEGDFTPYIFLSASTERDDVTTFITIEGDLSEPDISFSSAPELPEDEVLARLIFGRDLSSVTPLQAIQLASALNTLSGRGDVGIVNRLRENMGLDDLDLAADETGKAELRAGKYLSDDIYVDSAVDTDGKATINLNLDVTPDLTLKGSSDTNGRSSIGLFFEKDY